jgi:hypothetical protein
MTLAFKFKISDISEDECQYHEPCIKFITNNMLTLRKVFKAVTGARDRRSDVIS